MMNDYSQDRFYEVVNDEIFRGPFRLPKSWKNTSGIWHLGLSELADRGIWQEVRVGDDAAYNPAVETLEGPVMSVDTANRQVTATWTVRSFTQQELDDIAAAKDAALNAEIDGISKATLGKVLFKIVNEIRALQGNPDLTVAQFKAWVKSNAA